MIKPAIKSGDTTVFVDSGPSAGPRTPLIVRIGRSEFYIGNPPSDLQWEFISADEPEQLYGGAKRGGKSVGGSQKLACLAVAFPGNKLGMYRQDLTDLRESVLETFFKIVPPELILDHHKTNKDIFIRTGSKHSSKIHYEGLQDMSEASNEESAKGKENGAFYIDEPSEVAAANYRMIRAQLTWQLPDGSRPPYMAMLGCNPEPGWVYDNFAHLIDPTEEDESLRVVRDGRGKIFIKALPRDNPYLPPNWESQQEIDAPKEWIDKYLRGSWKVSTGQRFKELDERLHCVDMPPDWYLKTLILIASIDHASTGVTDMLIEGMDPDGNTVSLLEYRETNKLISQHASGMARLMERAAQMCGKGDLIRIANPDPTVVPSFRAFEYILIDPSTQAKTNQGRDGLYANIDEYRRNGIPCVPAFNALEAGLNLVDEYLHPNVTHAHPWKQAPGGGPLWGSPSTFIVKKECAGLWKDLVGLRKTVSETGAVKYVGEDHGLDNKRYILMSRPEPPNRTPRDIVLMDGVTRKLVSTHEAWAKNFGSGQEDNTWFGRKI